MLRTKLHRPPVTPDLVTRSALIDLLELNRHLPLTLVSAPAGYGKSVLVSQWLARANTKSAWISLDNSFNDTSSFLEYLVAAMDQVQPEALKTVKALLDAPEPPPLDTLIEVLVNALDEVAHDFIVVLDDYHQISAEAIHNLIKGLLQYTPQHLHLVLITRRDPPLDLHRMKLYGRMNEVRMKDLSFSESEIDQLFQNLMKVQLEAQELSVLREKTEGWIVGLRMVILTEENNFDRDRLFENIAKGLPVSEFLIKETLNQQDPAVRNWMLISSIFPVFHPELIERVSNRVPSLANITDSVGLLQNVKEANLFLIPLDNTGEWFRYHHLFQDLLRGEAQKLWSTEILSAIHLEAHHWFLQQGLLDEALEQALTGGHFEAAVELVVNHRYQLMGNEDWNRLNRWMNALPEELVNQEALLLTTSIFLYEYRGQLGSMIRMFSELEANKDQFKIRPEWEAMWIGEYNTILAEMAFIQGDGENSRKLGQQALKILPNDALYIRTFAMYWYIYGHQMAGEFEKGEEAVMSALKYSKTYSQTAISRLHIALAALHLMNGQLQKAMYWAHQGLEYGQRFKLNESITLAYSFIAKIHYLRNEVEQARPYFERLLENRFIARGVHVLICSMPHIGAYLIEGNKEKADQLLAFIRNFSIEMNRPEWSELLLMLEADYAMRTGEWDKLKELTPSMNFDHAFPPAWFSYHTPLIPIKVLTFDPSSENLESASEKITKLVGFGQSTNNVNFLITALPLQALIEWKKGNHEDATTILKRALELGEAEDYIRPYLDLGEEMKTLLEAFQQEYPGDYLQGIIASFPAHKQSIQPTQLAGLSTENLTQREHEILTLISNGFRNKEIASKLFISTDTVKRHIANIYQKLDVHSRVALINKAKELDMLPVD